MRHMSGDRVYMGVLSELTDSTDRPSRKSFHFFFSSWNPFIVAGSPKVGPNHESKE